MYQVDQALCNGCEACVAACGVDAVAVVNGRAQIDQQACRGCGECTAVCPQGAIRWLEEPVVALATTTPVATMPVASAAAKPLVPSPTAGTRLAWRRSFWPIVGSALVWVARELLPEALAAWRASRAGDSPATWVAMDARRRWAAREGGGHRHRWGRS